MAPPLARALSRRAAAAGAAALFAILLAAKARLDPRCVFLPSRPPARWIRTSGPAVLAARPFAPGFARFRASFDAPPVGVRATLAVRARAASEVVLDGVEILPPGVPAGGWTGERRAALTAGAGRHELLAVVRADDAPPFFWAAAPELGLYTGAGWQGSADGGKTWAPARDAQAPPAAEEFAALPGAAAGFWLTLPRLIPFLLLGAWLARRLAGPRGARLERAGLFVAAAAWLVLAAAAIAVLRPGLGYDAEQHVDYVARLARTGTLPGPGDGWQTFQAPLYYLLSVPLWSWASRLGREPSAWLRLPSLLSGFALGLACARLARAARPRRPDLALAAGLFGWFWAANLFVAQNPGNEPLAGALAALFLAECVRRSAPERPLRLRDAAALGALLGAALLSKFSAVLAIPSALLLTAGPLGRAPRGRAARWAGAFAVCAFAAGGWFYARSWALYGAPFIGGWDPSRGIAWWQDPGARSAGDFLRFGTALTAPFYSGLHGFWDALYSTFWTDGWQSGVIAAERIAPRPPAWQAAGAWWGLAPTALMARGAGRALGRGDAPSGAALLGAGVGTAALLWLFLTVPVYSTVKASYLLGLAPLFALLLADGLDGLGGPARAAAWAGLAAWAAASFRAALPL